jgi:hypothetical protein
MNVCKELERLRNLRGGIITPEQVVAAAKPRSSPLHLAFTWDDGEAAHQWRLEQARHLLRVYVTVIDDGKQELQTRMFVSLSSDRRGEGGYRAITDVLGNAAMRKQLLEDARTDMMRFRQKYAGLVELSNVFESMGRHLKPQRNQVLARR